MTFKNTAANPTNVLKYRNRHVFRGDIQFSLGDFEIGFSQKYQSAFENIDFSFLTLIDGVNSNWKSGNNAGLITDIRAGYRLNESIKIQLQTSNVTQNIFMGRPADLNAPRFYQMQLNYKFLGTDKTKIPQRKKVLESR
jgi:hypothetical protein